MGGPQITKSPKTISNGNILTLGRKNCRDRDRTISAECEKERSEGGVRQRCMALARTLEGYDTNKVGSRDAGKSAEAKSSLQGTKARRVRGFGQNGIESKLLGQM